MAEPGIFEIINSTRAIKRLKSDPVPLELYPCVQNILLACRALGLGASVTTIHQMFEAELHEWLGVPDDHAIVALLPIGYPKGKFGPVRRTPSSALTHFDRWGNRDTDRGTCAAIARGVRHQKMNDK